MKHVIKAWIVPDAEMDELLLERDRCYQYKVMVEINWKRTKSYEEILEDIKKEEL